MKGEAEMRLNKSVLLLIILMICFMIYPAAGRQYASATQKQDKVLFISSYSLNYPTVSKQIAGIREGLPDDVYIYYEFMDSNSIQDDEYVSEFYNYIRYKYSRISGIDAVIVGDDNALQMALRFSSGFFSRYPVIYESIDSSTRAELANSMGMVGISEYSTIKENIDLAKKLYPDADKLIAISDDSATGKVMRASLKALRIKYSDMDIEAVDTSELTQKEIISVISHADKQTILLFMCFTGDKEGKSYTYEEAIDLVVRNSPVPVFTLAWIGKGSIGGIAVDSRAIGRKAGEITAQIIDGASPSSVNADINNPMVATFDAGVMKKFKIRKDEMPGDAVYKNDTDMTSAFIPLICILGIVSLALVLLLVRSKLENKRRKTIEAQLKLKSDQLRSEAELDALTGLLNRRSFERGLTEVTNADRCFALMIIDLDDFKNINDKYGHLTGDLVLKEVGFRLNSMKSRIFVPFRYGGDEFTVLFFSDDMTEAEIVGDAIIEMFKPVFIAEGVRVKIDVSIGISCFKSDTSETAELISNADRALYYAKKAGKNRSVSFADIKMQH